MGINAYTLAVCAALARRAPLGRVATLGRLAVTCSPKRLAELLGPEAAGIRRGEYCETLLARLGATEVRSFDASDYEGATDIADLNHLLEVDDPFDLVIDGGTVEHVFDIAQAFENVSRLCRPGGAIVHSSPTNNYCGHGFWQLSPAVFHELYTPDRGYSGTRVWLGELKNTEIWYEIDWPRNGARVNISNDRRLMATAFTRRVADAKWTSLYQGDYSIRWEGENKPTRRAPRSRSFWSRWRQPAEDEKRWLSDRHPYLVRQQVDEILKTNF